MDKINKIHKKDKIHNLDNPEIKVIPETMLFQILKKQMGILIYRMVKRKTV